MPTIRQLRDAHLLTQAELAQRVGVSIQSASKWERGLARPRYKMLRKLGEVFGIDPHDIAFEDGK